jgi:hypothetical protein
MADNTQNFWTNAAARDPKRGFRFRVQLQGTAPGSALSGILWYAKKASKPSVSFSEASHNYLNHTYYWPARTEWSEVDITFVDPVEPDVGGSLADLLIAAGYRIPGGINAGTDFSSVSKSDSVGALGTVLVEQIDEDGNAVEEWTLNNGWVKEITFGDLDYGSDDLTEVTLKVRYDWATFTSPQSTVRTLPRFTPGSP